jgi:hypothetical protein
MKTYSWACQICPVWIEDAATEEHLERALLQHVETEHPRDLGIARAELAQGFQSVSLFDSVPTAEGETTSCVVCGASVTIEPEDPEAPLLRSFEREHVTRHIIEEGRPC